MPCSKRGLATFASSSIAVAVLAVAGAPASADLLRPPALGSPQLAAPQPGGLRSAVGQRTRRLHVKFAEGSQVRLRDGRFVTLGKDDLADLQAVLASVPDVRLERLFERPEAVLAADKVRIERESGRPQADLNLWYRLHVARDADGAALLAALSRLPLVQTAYAEPEPAPAPGDAAPAPSTSPDLTGDQDYAGPAPAGIGALAARAIPGGDGAGTRVIDIEYSWNTNHEDLSKARAAGASVPNQTPSDPFENTNHGTAVLGELVADDNAFGVTGLVPGASIGMTNAANVEDGFDLADSIDIARAALDDGDVILLEQQTRGANGGCDSDTQDGCVPVEWVPAFYDAIVSATSDGIIVVEAAGNGNQDLDAPEYGSPFPGGRADSGAIIVGASTMEGCGTPAHGRMGFSTYGERVDVHAYGECVATTGYGHVHGVSQGDTAYTGSFGGTSSASPIVTSAAAILSGIAQATGDAGGLTSAEARAALITGGTPQATGDGALTGDIGPMPDLASALGAAAPIVAAGGPYVTQEGADVVLRSTATAPGGGTVTYDWDLDDDGTFETPGQEVTFDRVGRDGSFPVTVRATTSSGTSATAETEVAVGNAAPAIAFTTDAPKAEGAPVRLTGTITDAGWLDPLTATVDWGDGAGPEPVTGAEEHVRPDGTIALELTRRFGDDATRVVRVCGADDDGQRCEQQDVQTTNVAPDVATAADQATSIDEGGQVQARSTFADPGWLDTYTGTVDWGSPLLGASPAELTLADNGTAPDTGTAVATQRFGDDGVFTVRTTVTDDDGGAGARELGLTVRNVAPAAAIDTSAATTINGVKTFLTRAGTAVPFAARTTDPGSDDLTLSWDWGDGGASPDVSTTSRVRAPGEDPDPSPDVAARDEANAQPHAFGDACLYDVTFRAADDDGGAGADAVKVLVGGTATRTRTAGWWTQQTRAAGAQLPAATVACHLAIARFVSVVFDESRDASTTPKANVVLTDTSTARARLDRQLLAALLNFANGVVQWTTPIDTNGDGVADRPFDQVVAEAEAVRRSASSTEAQLTSTKDLLERFNSRDG